MFVFARKNIQTQYRPDKNVDLLSRQMALERDQSLSVNSTFTFLLTEGHRKTSLLPPLTCKKLAGSSGHVLQHSKPRTGDSYKS